MAAAVDPSWEDEEEEEEEEEIVEVVSGSETCSVGGLDGATPAWGRESGIRTAGGRPVDSSLAFISTRSGGGLGPVLIYPF